MREQFVTELSQILGHIRFEPPDEFDFSGGMPEAAQSVALGVPTRLQHWLYQNCYCNRLAADILPSPSPNATPTKNLVAELSQANSGLDAWDSGWEISELLPNGQVRARKREVDRDFWPGEFITTEGPGLAPRTGMHLKAFFPKESAHMQPGFYFAFGNSAEEEFEELSIVRFYWAIESSGAAALLQEITGRLSRFQVPFRLKMPVDASFYNRLDAAVLYVNKRFYQITSVLLARVHQAVSDHLLLDTPLFTKRLAAGLGLAEDPGNGESFGMHRCRLLAEAISAAYISPDQTATPAGNVLDTVVRQLERAGVRADAPYLNAGSVDQYPFPLESGDA